MHPSTRYSGVVLLYEVSPSDGYYYETEGIMSGEVEGDQVGYTLSLSSRGSVVVVGGPATQGRPGSVAVAIRIDSTSVYTVSALINYNETYGSDMSVAITGDGNRGKLVSCYYDDDDHGHWW